MVLAHDKTEAVNVVLSDRAVKRLVGKTTTMLLEEIEDLAETPLSKLFPQQILDIANKDVTFNILISDDNVLINSTMYNATDAYYPKRPPQSYIREINHQINTQASKWASSSGNVLSRRASQNILTHSQRRLNNVHISAHVKHFVPDDITLTLSQMRLSGVNSSELTIKVL
ncbi:hypothetical protein POM88_015677 [Heracleum sosnowskyi]|uniref:Uncharacterized protein n=1 Tax=Heracleum sosnowskyi TaxID=360622 RepID=A0AAD8MWF3_9APIA|nr:hypothetical protein POM88_015677 [Heracleum sosnowskyi]